ncbi:MAG: Si-specific NAD(P)(+) transhydrogenase [Pseudomonadales bacterium]
MTAFDLFIVGSGPAGQKAAIQAAKGGLRVAVCEQLRQVGGACVQFGTIPSKALRERAMSQAQALRRLAGMDIVLPAGSGGVQGLIGEMTDVLSTHDQYMRTQLKRNGVAIVHGRAGFTSPTELNVRFVDGHSESFRAANVLIASGSKPRHPAQIAVDHEAIYDSDSILSLAYLPESLVVLGGGVIACEYASIFSLLGVKVTLVDRFPRPLGFLDADLTSRFLEAFEAGGGEFVGEVEVTGCGVDALGAVETQLADGRTLRSDKLLCAQGRIAQVQGLGIENAGLSLDARGLIEVDASGRTAVPSIYAAGDVIGPPSLASASMEQGRRVACAVLGIDPGRQGDWIPTGIYAVPELACVGLTETAARAQDPDCVTGIAHFDEIARGHIAEQTRGLLKLVVGRDRKILGIHIVGAQATELIHIGQMGLIHGASVDTYIENCFNFPTYGESYRVAALQVAGALDAGRRTAA